MCTRFLYKSIVQDFSTVNCKSWADTGVTWMDSAQAHRLAQNHTLVCANPGAEMHFCHLAEFWYNGIMMIFLSILWCPFFLFNFAVFKYLADKYLQKLKQQTAEDSELVHTSSNKIGTYTITKKPPRNCILCHQSLWSHLFPYGINTRWVRV